MDRTSASEVGDVRSIRAEGTLNSMAVKIGKSKDGYAMHYSVGTVIKKDGKFLLIDRANEPFGYAGVAGHLRENENPENAIRQHVKEEVNLEVVESKLLYVEELSNNRCHRGIIPHYWYLFECEAKGDPKPFILEAKSAGWFTPEEMKEIKFEPAWEYWFKKLGIL